jgi:hypothetical protein
MVEATNISAPDISASSFPVKVIDRKGKPLTEKTFSIAVDEKNEKTMDTDNEGQMKIPKPKSSIKFILKTPLGGSDESGVGATNSGNGSE